MAEPKRNLLDRAIEYVSPAAAARRLKARSFLALSGAYKGARRDRDATFGWNPKGGDADADTLPDLPELRDRSRELIRNAPIACGAIHTKVTNVVGTGLRLQSSIDRDVLGMADEEADAWEAGTEREFRLWAESQECDAARTLNFYQHQELVFRAVLESGDCFVLMPFIERPGSPYGMKLMGVEGDRVSNTDNVRDTSTLSGGVERDENGAPVSYHILNVHPGSDKSYQEKRWVQAPAFGANTGRRNVIHLYRMLRYGQTRGVPDLAPVIELVKQLDKYADNEIQRSVVSSLFTAFIRTETGEGLAGLDPTQFVKESNAYYNDHKVELGAGSTVQLYPDDKVDFADPSAPNTAAESFLRIFHEQIGVALELPYEVLVKHYTSSFSAAQAALLEAWKFFSARRQWLSDTFCGPVYDNWMVEAVARGRIAAPGFLEDDAIRAAYLGAAWVGPPRQHIDVVKQNKGDAEAEDRGWKTGAQNAAERGNDWEKVQKQRQKEKRMAGEASGPGGPEAPEEPGQPANQPMRETG